MCRLFGYRSLAPRPVRRFLLDGHACLAVLSHQHHDGWGIGHYATAAADRGGGGGGGEPTLVKSIKAAHADSRFARTAAVLESACVLVHIRRRSVGGRTLEDAHPFQWGRLLFAHNGTIRGFDLARPALDAAIHRRFARHLKGSTDSERCFLLLLTRLAERDALEDPTPEALADALAHTVGRIRALTGPVQPAHALNFLVTDGRTLAGIRAGSRELWYCARGDGDGVAEEVAVASEPLSTGESWTPLDDGEILLVRPDLAIDRLPLADALVAGDVEAA